MINHYSVNIREVILHELSTASSSIKIAVAWFTNVRIYNVLIKKLKEGLYVELVINNDDINISCDNDVDLDVFQEKGGVLHLNKTSKLMHDKFCVIDGKVVITGSYNWTNKAEVNDESITVFSGEDDTISFYLSLFNALCKKYPSEKNGYKKPAEFIVKPSVEVEKPDILDGRFDNGPSYKLNKFGVLSINGTTPLPDFNELEDRPWHDVMDKVRVVSSNVSISGRAFEDGEHLEKVVIYGPRDIGDAAFLNCINLKTIEAAVIHRIGKKAFMNCRSLKTAISANIIDDYAFFNCVNLVGLKGDVKDFILSKQFERSHRKVLGYSEYYPQYHITGLHIEKTTKTMEYFPEVGLTDEDSKTYWEMVHTEDAYTILKEVDYIGNHAFDGCTGLQNVSIPMYVDYLGDSSFANCSSLKHFKFTPGIAVIGHNVFSNCSSLTKVDIPSYLNVELGVKQECLNVYQSEKPVDKRLKDMPPLIGEYEIIQPSDIPDVLRGNHPLCGEGTLFFPLDNTVIVRNVVLNKREYYYLKVIINGKPRWLDLYQIVKVDRDGRPNNQLCESVLSINGWEERINWLKGKTINIPL